jgi:excisionase family DNA binding protein
MTGYSPGMNLDEYPDLLTPAEVARIFRVDPKTVTRWVKTGKLTCLRTIGGHSRFRKTEVDAAFKQAQ